MRNHDLTQNHDNHLLFKPITMVKPTINIFNLNMYPTCIVGSIQVLQNDLLVVEYQNRSRDSGKKSELLSCDNLSPLYIYNCI